MGNMRERPPKAAREIARDQWNQLKFLIIHTPQRPDLYILFSTFAAEMKK